MEDIKVSVITVNWNQDKFTIDCVKSVLKSKTEFKYEIIVVDNGSKPECVGKIKKEFEGIDNVVVLKLSENQGFTGGNNRGVEIAKGEYLIILNNDTTVEEDWMQILYDIITSDESIGGVNGFEVREEKIVDPELYKKYDFKLNPLQYGVMIERDEPREIKDYYETNGLKGACFIIKKGVVDPIFDEDYFIYAEEIKLSWKLRCLGYKIMTSNKAVYHHFHNAVRKSNSSFSKKAVYLGERNSLMNILTFYSIPRTLMISPMILLRIIGANVKNLRESPYRIKAYFYLLFHIPQILRKRREIRRIKKVSEKDLWSKMTLKMWPRSYNQYNVEFKQTK